MVRHTPVLVTLSLVLVTNLGVSSAARAAEDESADSSGPPDAPKESAAPGGEQPGSGAASGTAATKEAWSVVERLPASAYPEPVTRGLYGGSLWLNMQGVQWPYMPHTGVGVSGYGWIDNDYERTRIGDPGQSDHTTRYLQQGRVLLRITPTYSSGNMFVQAQAEFVANKDQTQTQATLAVVDAEDVWVRTGAWRSWDVTVGRFEAFEVYHLGMGLDVNTDERIGAYDGAHSPPALYGATALFYRPAGPGNIALHVYPTDLLRIEALGQWGNDGVRNTLGFRPAAIFDTGWLKVKAAAEYLSAKPQDPNPALRNETQIRGGAGSAQLELAPWLEFGPNVGYSTIDAYDPTGKVTSRSGKTLSYGGFVNARLLPDFLVGFGGNYTRFSNLHKNDAGAYDTSTNTQFFLALQYLLYHQLFIKVVGGYAKSHFEYSFSNMLPYNDDLYSARVRLMYLF
jgi:hypothetical protein